MPPGLLAQDALAPQQIEKLQADLSELNDLADALGLAFFLLLGHALLLAGWAAYRRVRPAAPGATRVPVGFVAWLFAGLVALPLAWWALVSGWAQLGPAEQADVIVIIHLGFVLAVLAAQVGVLAGWAFGWGWVGNFWFRLAHLLSIHLVASQAALGVYCPLTSWEKKLRGDDWFTLADATPLGRWCHEALFHPPGAIILVIYITFLLAVLLTWIFVPPRWPWVAADDRPAR